eukprot:NODE_304_length_11385_cov_0.300018.p6 type:complete len:132 gc:universal NODE_304_length_11385_cov_0.300018:2313-2708(+)
MEVIEFPTVSNSIAIVKYNGCICALEDTRYFMVSNIKLSDLRVLRQFFKIGAFTISGEYKLYELINCIYICSKDAGIIKDDQITSFCNGNSTITKYNDEWFVESQEDLDVFKFNIFIEKYKEMHLKVLKSR